MPPREGWHSSIKRHTIIYGQIAWTCQLTTSSLVNFDEHDSADEETMDYVNKEAEEAEKDNQDYGKPGSFLNRLIVGPALSSWFAENADHLYSSTATRRPKIKSPAKDSRPMNEPLLRLTDSSLSNKASDRRRVWMVVFLAGDL
jgi:hypothetical protein